MAIQQQINNPHSETSYKNAYTRLSALSMGNLTPGNMHGRIEWHSFASAADFRSRKPPVCTQVAFPLYEESQDGAFKTDENGDYVDADGFPLTDQNDPDTRVILDAKKIGLKDLMMMKWNGETMNDILRGFLYEIYFIRGQLPEFYGGIEI